MSETLRLRILGQDGRSHEVDLEGPLELGRQREGELAPYSTVPAAGPNPARLIIAPANETANVSRQHVLLDPLPSGYIHVTNRSKAPLSCPAAPGGVLAAGASAELTPPFSLSLPGRTVSVAPATPSDEPGLHSLSEQTVAPS